MSEAPFTATSFDNFCQEKKIMAARCKQCVNQMLPPRPMCRVYLSPDLR